MFTFHQGCPPSTNAEYFSLFRATANRFITSAYYLAYDTAKINSGSSVLRSRTREDEFFPETRPPAACRRKGVRGPPTSTPLTTPAGRPWVSTAPQRPQNPQPNNLSHIEVEVVAAIPSPTSPLRHLRVLFEDKEPLNHRF